MNTNVVLKACSSLDMLGHEWKQTSNAAILGAEMTPKRLQVVTVTLLAAMPTVAQESQPYTFTVTTTFGEDGWMRESEASTTLRINYVRRCASPT